MSIVFYAILRTTEDIKQINKTSKTTTPKTTQVNNAMSSSKWQKVCICTYDVHN